MTAGLLAVFVGWLLYHLLIKRDLKEHKDTLTLGGMFIGIWALLACWLWG